MAPCVAAVLALAGCSGRVASYEAAGSGSGEGPNGSAGTSNGTGAAAADAGAVIKVPLGTSPVLGPADAWVTLVEFGDFQCPFCGEEEPVLKALLAMYPADLRLVWKNFPITSIHRNAEGAAIAAECAREQGQFWPMHDLLFAHQTTLDPTDVASYASQISGLDVATWQTCLTGAFAMTAVANDVALAGAMGVTATPTFFVNGELVLGAVPEATLQDVIEQKLAEAEASGVPRSQYYDVVVLGEH